MLSKEKRLRSKQVNPSVTVSRGLLTIIINGNLADMSEADRIDLDRVLPAGNIINKPKKIYFDAIRGPLSNATSSDEIIAVLSKRGINQYSDFLEA